MDIQNLVDMQKWTLEQKIDHSVGAVQTFLARTGKPVYVSFSGGKDSTVLLDLVRRFVNKNIKAVFDNTGNEYPEIVRFVKSVPNVEIITPRKNIRDLIAQYGFPLISKEQAQYIRQAKTTRSPKILDIRLNGSPYSKGRKTGKISECWKFLIAEPFMVTEKCCEILKKKPLRDYEKRTGELPIIGTMADESRLRMQSWVLRGGCNSFKEGKEASFPLSIWTEKDIWDYIHKFQIPYCDLYNKKGCTRTGCMFCGFGAHLDKGQRFKILYEIHPQIYSALIDYKNNGVTYREALHKVGIILPDDPNQQLTLFKDEDYEEE